MKIIKYFIQFIFVIIFFSLFKILGLRFSSAFSGKIFEIIGPLFRSKNLIHSNIKKAFPNINLKDLNKINSQRLSFRKLKKNLFEEVTLAKENVFL